MLIRDEVWTIRYSNHSVVVLGQTFWDAGFGGISGARRHFCFPAIDRHSLHRGCSPSEPTE